MDVIHLRSLKFLMGRGNKILLLLLKLYPPAIFAINAWDACDEPR